MLFLKLESIWSVPTICRDDRNYIYLEELRKTLYIECRKYKTNMSFNGQGDHIGKKLCALKT